MSQNHRSELKTPSEWRQLIDISWTKTQNSLPLHSQGSSSLPLHSQGSSSLQHSSQPLPVWSKVKAPNISSQEAKNQLSKLENLDSECLTFLNDEDPLLTLPASQQKDTTVEGLSSIQSPENALMFSLSDEQIYIKDLVEKGDSIFFTGEAGTGKSTLLREIIGTLQQRHGMTGAVAVTASTGIAACSLGGVTIHRFAGIGIGTESLQVLVPKVKNTYKAVERWMCTQVLVIDEVSMISADLFDKLSGVGGAIRNSTEPFGGIQVVVTGDFFQLPPVMKDQNDVKFAFEAKAWKKTFKKSLTLTKTPEFIEILNEMRLGHMSAKSILRLETLSRTIDTGEDVCVTELFPRQVDVDSANRLRLGTLNTRELRYISKDGGTVQDPEKRAKLLGNFRAVECLALRIDAPVMLIKNIDDYLVNGSVGKVIAFKSLPSHVMETGGSQRGDKVLGGTLYPEVEFRSHGMIITRLISPETWKVKLPSGEVEASRTQLPLILAWAMSIHKSQGQTLQHVKVDLGRVFERGQAYVAISRATCLRGLQVLNFNHRKVIAHPKVLKWNSTLDTVS